MGRKSTRVWGKVWNDKSDAYWHSHGRPARIRDVRADGKQVGPTTNTYYDPKVRARREADPWRWGNVHKLIAASTNC